MWKLKVFVCLLVAYNCNGAGVRMSQDPPVRPNKTALTLEETPQFIMLTYDDAITIVNYEATYQHLFNITNSGNKCPISATFYVSHDNTNYQLVNSVWVKGHEVASHTITHKSPSDYWKNANAALLMDEIVGQRKIISKFAKIPESSIVGYRAPFLQTSGDTTFKFLSENGFKYDSSLPTQAKSRPWPIFPFTLDTEFNMDCVIPPCPSEKATYPDFWEFPLIDYWRNRSISEESSPPVYKELPCSMVDMCLPPPKDAKDAEEYFQKNFDRHYLNNRAPFPVYLHETWLSQDSVRKDGYFEFIKKQALKKDVFFVTIQEVIEWMRDPIPVEEYAKKPCKKLSTNSRCPFDITVESTKNPACKPYTGDDKNLHYLTVCGDCPPNFPRLGHPDGES